MALLFMDGAGHYDTAHGPMKWDTWQGWDGYPAVVTGRNGGKAIQMNFDPNYPNYGHVVKRLAVGASGTIGFAWYQTSAPTAGNTGYGPFKVYEGSIGGITHLSIVPTQSDPCILSVYRGTTLLGTGTISFPLATWHYVELQFTIGTSGSFELRINGITSVSGSGVNTKNGGTGIIDTVAWWTTANSSDLVTDLYVQSGGSFYGDCRVEALLPSGAGAETQWTPSGGTNYQNVDDASPNDDTDYNKSNTIGQTDTYAMTDLVSTTGIIYGVQKMNYVRKDNAGSRSVAPVLRIGGTDHVGASTSIGDSYVYTHEIEEVSPATLSAFTISEVNAMEAGIVVTA